METFNSSARLVVESIGLLSLINTSSSRGSQSDANLESVHYGETSSGFTSSPTVFVASADVWNGTVPDCGGFAGDGDDSPNAAGTAVAFEYEDFTQIGWVRYCFVFLYAVIGASSVIGNAMVIWTIARYRHMRTVTNYYILNLAVADFLVALVVMPLKLIEYTAPCQWHVFGHHQALCPLLYYVLPVFVFTSVLTLAAISIERYYAIVHPLCAMVVHSKQRTRKTIVATWIIPLILASPYLYCRSYTFTIHSRYGVASRQICTDRFDDLQEIGPEFRRGFFLFLFVVVYLVPLALIGGTCSRVAVTLHQRPSSIKNAAPPIVKQREDNKRRVARMIMLIALSFWVCWTPFYAVTAITQLQADSFLRKSQFLFTMLGIHWTGFINSCINPFIYTALSNKFRRSFKQILRWCCCRCCVWRTYSERRQRFYIECQAFDNNNEQAAARRVHNHLQQQHELLPQQPQPEQEPLQPQQIPVCLRNRSSQKRTLRHHIMYRSCCLDYADCPAAERDAIMEMRVYPLTTGMS